MANIRRWIAEARDLEDSGDLQGALSVYRKALVAQEETSGFADLSLYNGLGDLYLRAGDTPKAIEAYESAASQCEEQQLYANGIALCKKILRNAPDHVPAYRRAGRLLALSGLDAEAAANFREFAARETAAGRPHEAREALREMVELTADEEAAVDLADQLVASERASDALEMLRAARDRRERQGRDVVVLLRKIQELSSLVRTDDGEERPAEASSPTSAEPARPPSERSEPSSRGRSSADRAASDASGDPGVSGEVDASSENAAFEPSTSLDHADPGAITRELHRVLAEARGEDRFRYALPLVEHLLEFQPGRFELLHRKLAYAFALGDEQATISAYMALGECLDRHLESFTLRTLSTATPSGAVTAALKVEASGDAPIPESWGG
ncbi:MAG: tetratricopeptide repeat protein [Gemmatimonadota bacterium]|nr:tetratricopeptide repeat protein [Gemmatimonadota bacterium]